MTQYQPKFIRPKRSLVSRLAGPVSAVLTLVLLSLLLPRLGAGSQKTQVKTAVPVISEEFQALLGNSEDILPMALYGNPGQPETPVSALKVKKLNDADLMAPEPLKECYGQAETVEQMDWFVEKAAGLLQGQKLYFGPDRELLEGSAIKY